MGYLFMAAPAKCSRCSLPWMRGISSWLPLLTLNIEEFLSALLCLCSHGYLEVGLLPSGRCPWPSVWGGSSVFRRSCRASVWQRKRGKEHPKGNQSCIVIVRIDVEAEAPILWPPDAKSRFIWKDPDSGKVWGLEEKGMAEYEMDGWHHRLNAQEFGWTPGAGDGQGVLAYCSSSGRKELDTTEQLNWTETLWSELGLDSFSSFRKFFLLSLRFE